MNRPRYDLNNQITQITKSWSIMAMSASYTPYVAIEALIAVVHVTTEEVHGPCETGIANTGSRRPVEVRLHIGKGMATGKLWIANYAGINQACQFLNRR